MLLAGKLIRGLSLSQAQFVLQSEESLQRLMPAFPLGGMPCLSVLDGHAMVRANHADHQPSLREANRL